MKKFRGTISVIMPAFNESEHIYSNIMETCSVFDRTRCGYEVIVVDDGSTDATLAEARRAEHERRSRVTVVHCAANGGKGSALIEGCRRAAGDYIVFLDADLDLHPGQLVRFFRVMRDERAHAVIGSKHHPHSRIEYPAARRLVSVAYAAVLRVLFDLPVRDTQTGLKVFESEVLKRVLPRVRCKRYAYDLEILVNASLLGYRIAEAPVELAFSRQRGFGRIRLRDICRAGLDTLAILLRTAHRRDGTMRGRGRSEAEGRAKDELAGPLK